MTQQMTPDQLQAHLEKTGAFETEEFGFAQECAMQYGFEIVDDDGDVLQCTTRQLFTLMKALGYHRVARVHPAGHINPVVTLDVNEEMLRELSLDNGAMAEMRKTLFNLRFGKIGHKIDAMPSRKPTVLTVDDLDQARRTLRDNGDL